MVRNGQSSWIAIIRYIVKPEYNITIVMRDVMRDNEVAQRGLGKYFPMVGRSILGSRTSLSRSCARSQFVSTV